MIYLMPLSLKRSRGIPLEFKLLTMSELPFVLTFPGFLLFG